MIRYKITEFILYVRLQQKCFTVWTVHLNNMKYSENGLLQPPKRLKMDWMWNWVFTSYVVINKKKYTCATIRLPHIFGSNPKYI